MARARRLSLGLLLVALLAGCAEVRFVGCVAYANLTDPRGVRTDGFCYFEYLLRVDLRQIEAEHAAAARQTARPDAR
jgi:hypothetical protein